MGSSAQPLWDGNSWACPRCSRSGFRAREAVIGHFRACRGDQATTAPLATPPTGISAPTRTPQGPSPWDRVEAMQVELELLRLQAQYEKLAEEEEERRTRKTREEDAAAVRLAKEDADAELRRDELAAQERDAHRVERESSWRLWRERWLGEARAAALVAMAPAIPTIDDRQLLDAAVRPILSRLWPDPSVRQPDEALVMAIVTIAAARLAQKRAMEEAMLKMCGALTSAVSALRADAS